MKRKEFIEGLRRALAGKVDTDAIDEAVRYYEDYIDTQIRQGKSEEEVLKSLGNPALIAKSIVSANGGRNNTAGDAGSIYEYEQKQRYSRSKFGDKGVRFILNMPGWLATLLAGIILLMILSAIFSIISFVLPVIVPIVIILFVIHLAKKG